MIALSEPRLVVSREPEGDRKLVDKVLGHFRTGNALFDHGDFTGALDKYNVALTVLPDDPTILSNKGAVLSRLGRHKEALTICDKVLALQPQDPVVLHNRGVALAQLGRFEEAIESYDRALTFEPDDLGTLANRGLALAHLGRHAEALTALDRSLVLSPQDQGIISCRRKVLNELLRTLARKGVVSWSGGKPKGSNPPVELTPGPDVSDYVIEDRR